jgi:predicted transcriptional regulator
MRTTISIDDQLFLAAKQLAADSNKSFANIVEDALRTIFTLKKNQTTKTVSLITTGNDGLIHGVNLDDNAALNELMESNSCT